MDALNFGSRASGLSLAALLFTSTALSARLPVIPPEPWRFSFTSKRAVNAPRDYNTSAPQQTPPLFNGTAESIVNDAKTLVKDFNAVYDDVVAKNSPDNATFASAVLPMLQFEDQTSLSTSILYFYSSVSADTALRDASTNASEILDKFSIDSSTREDVFKLVDHVYKNSNTTESNLDDESKRVLWKQWKGYITNGLGLPAGAERDKYKELKTRIAELQLQYNNNYNGQSDVIWLTKEELAGVPDDVVSLLEKGTGENEGKLALTFKAPDLTPFMAYASNPDARQKVFIASQNTIKANIPLEKEAIVKRDESARILGYPNHAAFRLEDKMAHDIPTVNTFLNDLKTKLTERGQGEVAKLLDLKKADHAARNLSFDGNFYYWDRNYYSTKLIESEYSIDQNKVAEYFPMDHTITAMFSIYEELMGFEFIEVTAADRDRLSPSGKGTDLVWHPDVIMFSVWEADRATQQYDDAGFVGYLYLDLHPRPGKYGHFANFNIQPGFIQKDGKRHYPATALVCNFPRPTAESPSLLLHDEVVTFFHELGHGIHDLSGRTRYSKVHGTNVVQDFVEAPSQMLENWVWTPSTLKTLASHYKTNETMPQDLMDKLINTKHANEAILTLRQITYATFDMVIHTPATHEDAEKLDLGVTMNNVKHATEQQKGPEDLGAAPDWGHGETSFAHLMGGYDAGYYGYQWSKVYSTDMFYAAFKANPMDPAVGRRYRHEVLEKGGSQDELLTLTQFLGRPPNSDAFYKELGIEP